MKGKLAFLERWYDKTKAAAGHKRATPILCGIAFIESIFFPIPTDLMLMPMVQARPKAWWRLALLTSFFSVLGGVFGYLLGLMFFETIAQPVLEKLGFLSREYNFPQLTLSDGCRNCPRLWRDSGKMDEGSFCDLHDWPVCADRCALFWSQSPIPALNRSFGQTRNSQKPLRG